MLISTKDATDAIAKLDLTVGYPTVRDQLERLRDGLLTACEAHSVDPAKVVDKCLELSKYCPTPFDFHQVAAMIRSEQQESWKPAEPEPEARGCQRCGGTGWARYFALHTPEGHGQSAYVRKEWITEETYLRFNRSRFGPENRQEVASGVIRCNHDPRNARFVAAVGGATGAKL